jgi:hypothetical protein
MDIYKRNQIEDAFSALEKGALALSPKEVKSRIKRLLDTDRTRGAQGTDRTERHYAFFTEDAQGRGVEVQFSAYEVFALRLGLMMLDLGLPQATVVAILRATRSKLERMHRALLRIDIDDMRLLPPEPGRIAGEVENPVYLVLPVAADARGRIELGQRRTVAIRPARILRGHDALSEFLRKELGHAHSATIMELTMTALRVREALSKTVPLARGRH